MDTHIHVLVSGNQTFINTQREAYRRLPIPVWISAPKSWCYNQLQLQYYALDVT